MASSEPHRGEVWLVSFGAGRRGEPGKNRPSVVLSADGLLTGSDDDLVVVVPLSSSRSPSMLRPSVPSAAGIDSESAAICRAVRAVGRTRLLRRLGAVNSETLGQVENAVATVLGLELAA